MTAAVAGYVSVFLEAGCCCCCWAAALVVGVSGERKTVEVGSEAAEAAVCAAAVGVDSLAAATAAALTSPLSSGGVISTS